MAKRIIKKASEDATVDYKELVGFLGKKFEKIDQRFEKIDQRFEKIDQRFDKIDQRFEIIETKLEEKADRDEMNEKFDSLRDEMLTHIDGLAQKIDDYQTEQAMINGQLARHEKWHFKVASKEGVDLLKE